jgi:hypothetical protein
MKYLIFFTVFLIGFPVFGANYSVSTSAELHSTFQNLQPGDTLFIQAGTYDSVNLYTPRAGAPGAHIVLKGAGEGITILDQGYDTTKSLTVGGAKGSLITIRHGYWVLEDMTLRNSYDLLVQFQYHTPYCVLRRLELTRWGCFAVKPYVYHWDDTADTMIQCGPDNLYIEDIYAHLDRTPNDSRGGSANVFDLLGGDSIRIRNCYLKCDYFNYAGFVKGNSSYSIFENNIVKDGGVIQGYGVGWSLGGGLTGTGRHWFKYDDETWEARHSLVRNNVFINMGDYCVHTNKAMDTKIYHNTFIAQTSGQLYAVQVKSNCTAVQIRNNLFAGDASPSLSGTAVKASNVTASGYTWFSNPGQEDYRLRASTPPINACPALPEVTEDFNGYARDNQPDAGAFEFGSTVIGQSRPGTRFKIMQSFPNPAHTGLSIKLLITDKKDLEIKIFALDGRCVYRFPVKDIMYGINTLFLPNRSMSSGVYLVKVTQGRQVHTSRITLLQ